MRRRNLLDIDIEIDSLTDCLIERSSGMLLDTEFRLVAKTITKEIAEKLQSEGWKFDWSIPHKDGCEIYALTLKDSTDVEGLIALKHFRSQFFTYVELVETAPHNYGHEGKYIGVGAHLFAIACKLSWDVGNEGYVQFVAKSALVEHYQKTLNAKCIDLQRMYIDSAGAIELIKKYFPQED